MTFHSLHMKWQHTPSHTAGTGMVYVGCVLLDPGSSVNLLSTQDPGTAAPSLRSPPPFLLSFFFNCFSLVACVHFPAALSACLCPTVILSPHPFSPRPTWSASISPSVSDSSVSDGFTVSLSLCERFCCFLCFCAGFFFLCLSLCHCLCLSLSLFFASACAPTSVFSFCSSPPPSPSSASRKRAEITG